MKIVINLKSSDKRGKASVSVDEVCGGMCRAEYQG